VAVIGFRQMERRDLRGHIAAQIRGAIEQGRLKVGDKLPPEKELAVQLGVSRVALRETLRELVAVASSRFQIGKGTFISSLFRGHWPCPY